MPTVVVITSLLLALAPVKAAHALSVPPGSVCDGVDTHKRANETLRGLHLRVLDIKYKPYAVQSPNAPYGWEGYDVDLLEAVARICGFTFEIIDAERRPDESYTELLLRTVDSADLWASWWAPTEERIEKAVMLTPHVDTSPVLVAPPPVVEDTRSALENSLYDFYLPFSPTLWALLIAMIALSGIVDYLLERGRGGSLSQSINEYFAGVLWGGFHEPLTRLSAVYQCFVALTILITVSAYTANLASFMILSHTPQVSFSSITDLQVAGQTVCSLGSFGVQAALDQIYVSIYFDKSYSHPTTDLAQALVDGACPAAMVPKETYDSWLNRENGFCELSLVGATLLTDAGGWVTSRTAAYCLQRPIEVALYQLKIRGEIQRIYDKWNSPVSCLTTSSKSAKASSPWSSSSASAGTGSRRRLAASSYAAPAASSAGHGQPRDHATADDALSSSASSWAIPALGSATMMVGRRLTGGHSAGGAGAAAVSSASSSSAATSQMMTWVDFFGIFVLWLVASVAVLLLHALMTCAACAVVRARASQAQNSLAESSGRALSRTSRVKSVEQKQPSATVSSTMTTDGDAVTTRREAMMQYLESTAVAVLDGRGDERPPGVPRGIDTSDAAAMMRFALGEQHRTLQAIEGLRKSMQQHVPSSPHADDGKLQPEPGSGHSPTRKVRRRKHQQRPDMFSPEATITSAAGNDLSYSGIIVE